MEARKKLKNNIRFVLIVVYAVVLIGLYVVAFFIPSINGAMTETYVVNYGSIVSSHDSNALVVRDEKCFYSQYTGTATYYIEESQKTRIKTKITDIYSGGSKNGLYCEKTGFVSYYYDGYEDILTPSSIVDQDPATYLGITGNPVDSKKDSVSKGDFLFKVVDGSNWYILLPVDEEILRDFRIGSNLEVILNDGTTIVAEAQRVLGDKTLCVMAKVLSYYPDFAKVRNLYVKVLTNRTTGLEIPSTAVYELDGNKGVDVLGTDGEYHFTRVSVLEEKNGVCIVPEDKFTVLNEDGTQTTIPTISLYDEIKRIAN